MVPDGRDLVVKRAAVSEGPERIHLGDTYDAADDPDAAGRAWLRAAGTFEQIGRADDANRVRDKLARPRP